MARGVVAACRVPGVPVCLLPGGGGHQDARRCGGVKSPAWRYGQCGPKVRAASSLSPAWCVHAPCARLMQHAPVAAANVPLFRPVN
jgi:hypothetical protein